MSTPMLYSMLIDNNYTGDLCSMKLLSSTEVLKALEITPATLYKWIWFKKIKVHRYKIGNRTYNGFDPKEVERVKKLMVERRQLGKPLFKK